MVASSITSASPIPEAPPVIKADLPFRTDLLMGKLKSIFEVVGYFRLDAIVKG